MKLAGRIGAYARFSTDRQNPTSCADQIAKLRAHARALGAELAQVFVDDAVSGAVRHRPGMDDLVRAVDAGVLDVVLVEDIGRLSRDVEDLAWFRKRLAFRGVRLIAVDDGLDTEREGSELQGDVYSVFKAQFRREVAQKTLRGMEGKARLGLATGGVPYGYRTERSAAGAVILIDEPAAAIVREIFDRYAAGRSLAAIATELNRRGLLPPRGGRPRRHDAWGVSTVRAVLRNASYVGRWSFGRRRWQRDPDTRRRQPQERQDALVVSERPELAIVDVRTWDAVHARFESSRTVYTGRRRIPAGIRFTHPLSGLLVCAECGSLFKIGGGDEGRRYYRCTGSIRGRCEMARSIRESVIRERVLGAIRLRFASPAVLDLLERFIADELAQVDDLELRRRELAMRIEKNEARVRRLVLAIADGSTPDAVLATVRELEVSIRNDRAELDANAAKPRAPITLTPAETLAEIAESLEGSPELVRTAVQRMLDGGRVEIHREPDGKIYARGGLLPAMLLGRDLSWIAGARYPRESLRFNELLLDEAA